MIFVAKTTGHYKQVFLVCSESGNSKLKTDVKKEKKEGLENII